MREMKPLILPRLVAARKSSKSSFDMAAEPTSSIYSCADSGFYSVSDCSTPPTPSFSTRGHHAYPSSTSSLSSSPPTYDPIEVPNASGKLPKLTEEPVEREDDAMDGQYRCSCNNDPEVHLPKRRRSAEPSPHSLTNKIERRFPSLSRKVRDRKRASTLQLGRSSRSATPSRVPSTRTSSITSSINQVFDINDKFPVTARSSRERVDDIPTSSPIDIDVSKANAFEFDPEEVAKERFATTPLLPPLLVKTRFEDVPAQSPLQSPTVADAGQSRVATPIGTPPFRAYPTPPLSSKPSISSFRTSRPGHMVPSTDIPPIMLADPNDRWAIKLGHANFTIQPEPYVPELCDAASLRHLFADWEQARCNFTKHQVRTGEHFGTTSKTYMLTGQKWAEIDAVWKANHDLAISRATQMGEEPEPSSPLEPAPLSIMPTLNDPHNNGKFPKLGDEDIVGPMVQIAAQIQKTPTKKRAFFKFFSDMKFPSSFLGRSSSAAADRAQKQ
ncbi:hypothetical protein P154DRAFT_552955 [Amniculicola lignicola CBS 123094]|uniref:Only prolin and serin are matching in the corresponding protein n=1 Tax=Amniculicola lignicola CBS 123094 TaxID=1392246 RepID=A0A6A5WLP3_9PLEO|nr:hypothetical protein P154DRAFT_552955 [Amniculicola lignicola CBS 123094]